MLCRSFSFLSAGVFRPALIDTHKLVQWQRLLHFLTIFFSVDSQAQAPVILITTTMTVMSAAMPPIMYIIILRD